MSVRLDRESEADIWEIFHRISYIGIAKDAFLSMVLKCPVKARLKSFSLVQSDELAHLLKTHWLTWKRNMYVWLKMFGVCPWYFVKVRNTIHRYPVVPPFGSGHITTRLNKKHFQEFEWHWSNGDLEKKMHFEVRRYPPTIYGQFTTPLISLLDDYRSLKIARESLEIAWVNQARPQHILEYKPNIKFHGENDALIRFGDWEQHRYAEATDATNTYSKVHAVRVKNAQQRVKDAITANQMLMSNTRYMKTDTASQQFELENGNILKKIVPLPADFTYKSAAIPNVQARMQDLSNAIDAKAASIMDFPVQMMSGSAKTTAQSQNNLRNVNERVKDWLGFFEERTKNALMLVYGSIIEREMANLNEFIEHGQLFMAHKELVVEMECTPVTTYDDLRKYVTDGIMNVEDFARHAFSLNAIPESQITIKEDAMEPQEKKRKKDDFHSQ